MRGKIALIYNPLAGPGNLAPIMEQIALKWQNSGWDVLLQPTNSAGHATILASQAAEAGFLLVLAAGGDGTLGEVVNGLAGSQTIMGILPVGTANSFARELEMPIPGFLEIQATAVLPDPFSPNFFDNKLTTISDALMAGRVHEMDLGWTKISNGEGRYWMLWTSVGADGYMVHEMEPRPKWTKKIGRADYILRGIPILTRFSHIHAHVEIDGHPFEGDYVLALISNSRRYAGGLITLTKAARLDDGLLEIWLFGGQGFPSISRHAFQALRGQHLKQPDTLLVHGKHVVIQTDPPAPLQMDGDPVGQTPIECQIKPAMLRLLVPNFSPTDLFKDSGNPFSSL